MYFPSFLEKHMDMKLKKYGRSPSLLFELYIYEVSVQISTVFAFIAHHNQYCSKYMDITKCGPKAGVEIRAA